MLLALHNTLLIPLRYRDIPSTRLLLTATRLRADYVRVDQVRPSLYSILHIYVYTYIDIYVCKCIYIYMYIHTHIYINMYAHTHTHTHIYIYIYIYTYIHIHIHPHSGIANAPCPTQYSLDPGTPLALQD